LTISLLESIDKPIRDLVVNINRIGLQTVFSCCGFTYPDEEETKSHAIHPYVIFKDPHSEKTVVNFFDLAGNAFRLGWQTQRYHTNQWKLFFEEKKENSQFYQKLPGKSYSLHDYELKSIAIWRLNDIVRQMESYANEATITDGNQFYHDLGIHWQIEAKPPMTITFKNNGERSEPKQEVLS
jgi:hypothetical protein